MIDKELLRRLRNDLPMPVTIAALGNEGPPAKMSESPQRAANLPASKHNGVKVKSAKLGQAV